MREAGDGIKTEVRERSVGKNNGGGRKGEENEPGEFSWRLIITSQVLPG